MHKTLLVLLLSAVSLSAQVKRVVHETFDRVPHGWSWIADYHDNDVTRTCGGGSVRSTVRNGNNYWSIMYRPIDAEQEWSVSATVVLEESKTNEGMAVTIACGEDMYYFKIAGGYRSQWVGSYNFSSKEWRNITEPDARGLGDKACAAIKPNGVPNTLTVRRTQDSVFFVINDSIVEQWSADGPFDELAEKVTGFGLTFSGNVTGRCDDFHATYTEPPMPVVADAFKGVHHTFLPQFAGKGSRYPVIAPNGQQLYFIMTRDGRSDDIFVADALTDSTWSAPRLLPGVINTVDPNNVISVSQDGNELLVWGTYNADGSPSGPGFSTTRRTADAWSIPVKITNNHQQNRSSTREECLSADRSVMIAAREIDGETNGRKDLYVSFRGPDGSYGELINLGEAVNTSGEEGAPYLAADGVTLYFNSTENTYGDADIFVTKRLDDTWRNWSPRINLGPTINTPFWDCYFTIHPSGEYAYMNTSYGANDGIFRLTLPQDAASRKLLPEPVVVVRGRVFNASTKKPLGVDIQYEDLSTGKAIGSAVSAPSDGRYSIILKGGMNYGFFAEKDGFFPVSDNIELTSLKAFAEVERDLYLEPIVVGAVIRLNNLFFDTDKATIRPESGTELDRLADMLRNKPTMSVAIEGHTDDRGATQHNAALSQARAEAVRTYLTSKGIDAARLTAKGYGKTKPLTKGTSDLDRQRNRRVEFRIVSL